MSVPERLVTPVTGLPSGSDRFLGALLGMGIGDALGMPHTGRRATPVSGYEPLLDERGDVRTPAGQFTAHTELALCLVETLVTGNGFIDPDLAGYRFVQVLRSENAHFLDATTRAALERAEATGDFQAGLPSGHTVEPGPAARIVPVGLVHALGRPNSELLVREVLRATLITHADPEAVNAALALAWAIGLVVRRETLPEMLPAEVLAFIDEDAVARTVRLAHALLASAAPDDEALAALDGPSAGHAVARALYLFARHGGDVERVTLLAAGSGHEAAATAAMAGALAGAWAGARAIPVPLVEGLDGRMYFLMAAPALYRTAQRRAGLFLQLHQLP